MTDLFGHLSQVSIRVIKAKYIFQVYDCERRNNECRGQSDSRGIVFALHVADGCHMFPCTPPGVDPECKAISNL